MPVRRNRLEATVRDERKGFGAEANLKFEISMESGFEPAFVSAVL
jgi:hypothetical protein